MTMNPLPPQAYTKETLVLAYEWLNKQSKEIREMCGTPDILVSLYNKAKMQGDEALERPSIKNFKNELKKIFPVLNRHSNDKIDDVWDQMCDYNEHCHGRL